MYRKSREVHLTVCQLFLSPCSRPLIQNPLQLYDNYDSNNNESEMFERKWECPGGAPERDCYTGATFLLGTLASLCELDVFVQ